MKVIKRDGRIQNFNKNKIMLAIMRASDDAKEPFNTSDIKNVTTSILKAIGDRGTITNTEIREITLKVLREFGFEKAADFFENG